MDEATGPFHS